VAAAGWARRAGVCAKVRRADHVHNNDVPMRVRIFKSSLAPVGAGVSLSGACALACNSRALLNPGEPAIAIAGLLRCIDRGRYASRLPADSLEFFEETAVGNVGCRPRPAWVPRVAWRRLAWAQPVMRRPAQALLRVSAAFRFAEIVPFIP